MYYILDDNNNPKKVERNEGNDFFRNERRFIKETKLKGCRVSTVFLVIDHNYHHKGNPVLFETMIFGGEHDSWGNRYCTYDEALKGHEEAVRMIKNGENLEESF